MIRLLFPLLLLILAIVLARRYIAAATPEQKNSRKITVLLVAMSIVLLILTLEHRMHWLAATVPPVILTVRKIFSGLSQTFKPGIQKENSGQVPPEMEPPSSQHENGKMTEVEAKNILGLKHPCHRGDIIEAHRKLMQKLHPDHGGNDYLAAKINEAKDFLLKNT
jgi:hypothetical protein